MSKILWSSNLRILGLISAKRFIDFILLHKYHYPYHNRSYLSNLLDNSLKQPINCSNQNSMILSRSNNFNFHNSNNFNHLYHHPPPLLLPRPLWCILTSNSQQVLLLQRILLSSTTVDRLSTLIMVDYNLSLSRTMSQAEIMLWYHIQVLQEMQAIQRKSKNNLLIFTPIQVVFLVILLTIQVALHHCAYLQVHRIHLYNLFIDHLLILLNRSLVKIQNFKWLDNWNVIG